MSAWLCAAAHMSADCSPQPSFFALIFGSPRPEAPLCRVNPAAARGSHQRSFTIGRFEIRIGPGLEQGLKNRRGTDNRRFRDSRGPELVLQLYIRSGLDQCPYKLEIAVRGGVHDGSGAVSTRLIHVGALHAQQAHGCGMVPGFRRFKQASLGSQHHGCAAKRNCNYGYELTHA